MGRAATGGYHEIAVEHLLAAMLAGEEGDVARMLHEAGADRLRLLGRVERALERMTTGQSGRPVISERVFRWMEDAWLWASVEVGATRLRSGHLFLQLLARPERYLGDTFPELAEIDVSAAQGSLADVLGVAGGARGGAGAGGRPWWRRRHAGSRGRAGRGVEALHHGLHGASAGRED